jgi:hypothetical protein
MHFDNSKQTTVTAELIEAHLQESLVARTRSRFVAPVMLVNGKVWIVFVFVFYFYFLFFPSQLVCRSSTLARAPEINGRKVQHAISSYFTSKTDRCSCACYFLSLLLIVVASKTRIKPASLQRHAGQCDWNDSVCLNQSFIFLCFQLYSHSAARSPLPADADKYVLNYYSLLIGLM